MACSERVNSSKVIMLWNRCFACFPSASFSYLPWQMILEILRPKTSTDFFLLILHPLLKSGKKGKQTWPLDCRLQRASTPCLPKLPWMRWFTARSPDRGSPLKKFILRAFPAFSWPVFFSAPKIQRQKNARLFSVHMVTVDAYRITGNLGGKAFSNKLRLEPKSLRNLDACQKLPGVPPLPGSDASLFFTTWLAMRTTYSFLTSWRINFRREDQISKGRKIGVSTVPRQRCECFRSLDCKPGTRSERSTSWKAYLMSTLPASRWPEEAEEEPKPFYWEPWMIAPSPPSPTAWSPVRCKEGAPVRMRAF